MLDDTTRALDLCLTVGKGWENAFALWSFYRKIAQIQNSNIIICQKDFTSKETGFGRGKIISAKKTLKQLGLIDERQIRNGKFQYQYIIEVF